MDDVFLTQIKKDVVAWSGLPVELVSDLIDRKLDFKMQEMYECLDFLSEDKLFWFYRTASLYFFQTAIHKPWPLLECIKEGPVLDYGGGMGNNFFPLIKKGLHVDFFEISYCCLDFVAWKLENKSEFRNCNYKILNSFHEGRFDSVLCLSGRKYNAIIFESVLEHVPDYERLLVFVIKLLNKGGMILEISPFGNGGKSYHLKEKTPVPIIMYDNGMISHKKNVWVKQ